MRISRFWVRIMGIIGILGGIVLFIGDLLFYFDWESTDLKLNMANASDMRILLSGVAALVATWFYLVGLGQVFYAFRQTKRWVLVSVVLAFGSILVAYGIIHAQYGAIATAAKLAQENHLNIGTATSLAVKTNLMLRNMVYPIFAFLSILFLWQVWTRKTLYPRWMVLFFPTLPFLLKGVFERQFTGGWWIIVNGGYLNILLIVFFLASSIALWRKPS